ncbi:MAG: hypothetical protein H7338_05390 [Candidatus Sericytochromatia bacterium]|nr:hypothetical protein [Candidatus Sericytochromatia bacterium]
MYWLAPVAAQFKALAADTANEGRFKQVVKALKYLNANPRHLSLNTRPYDDPAIVGPAGEKVFEAYAQNQTPGAYRIFWCYGPLRSQITIIAITEHPND